MKPWILIPCAVFCALCYPRSEAQTLEWGVSEVKVPLIDSDGDGIDDNFVFELGAFAMDFDPNESNVGQWLTHWRVFDRLIWDPIFEFGTSAPIILNNVTSESDFASHPDFSFAGLDGYMWVRNDVIGDDNKPIPGSEWLLIRHENWTFPLTDGDCCDNQFIDPWWTSDLTSSDVPIWGWQNIADTPDGTQGPGKYSQEGFDARSVIKQPDYDRTPIFQTHTIPEPSSALLTSIAGLGVLLRRRRNA